MDYGLRMAVLLLLPLFAPPVLASGQSSQSAGQAQQPSASARAAHAATVSDHAVPDHAVSGVVKTLQANRLVIMRAGKNPQEMTFALNPSTEREGPIGVGVKVQVRFRGDGHPPLATAVLATPPAKLHSD